MIGRTWQFLRAGGGRRLRVFLIALWKLGRDPRTPRAAKWVALATIAYAASPIDLIPDFIPVLGQLDDLVILPLGVALAIRLTPAPLWHELLEEAERAAQQRLPRRWWMGVLVVIVWVLCLVGLWLAWTHLRAPA